MAPGELITIGAEGIGWAVGCSRRGAAHRRSQMPCQDAHAIWSGSIAGFPCLVVAVADGHGDDRHDLSQFGAALAVRASVEELLSCYARFGSGGPLESLRNSFRADCPRRIGRRWREAVLQDAKLRIGDVPNAAADQGKIVARYGTTLLVTLVTPDALLLGQIGDGDILFVRPDGSVDCPLVRDSGLVGTITYSLSSPESHLLWQTATLAADEGGLLLLSSDGLANAFGDDEQFQAFARSLVERISEFGLSRVAAALPGWLDDYSQKASGDDITLVLVRIEPRRPPQPAQEVAQGRETEEPPPETRYVAGETGRPEPEEPAGNPGIG